MKNEKKSSSRNRNNFPWKQTEQGDFENLLLISQGPESTDGVFRVRGDLGSESLIGERDDSTEIEFTRLPSATVQFVAELQPPLFLFSAAASIVI